jgi:N-acetylmuramoyl-L-alanine amidase
VDGKDVALDVPVRWWTGQAHVPLSFVLSPVFQSFAQATIAWDAEHKVLAVIPIPDISSPRFTSGVGRTVVSFDVSSRVEARVLREGDGFLIVRFFGGTTGERERLDVQDLLVTSVDMLPRGKTTDVMLAFGPAAGRPVVMMEESPRRVKIEVRRSERSVSAEEQGEDEPSPEAPSRVVPSVLPVASAPAVLKAAPEKSATPTVVAVPLDDEEKAEPKAGSKAPPNNSVIDDEEEAVEAKEDEEDAPVDKKRSSAETALLTLSPVRVIVIDPGHGGKDVGAVGRRGTLEKDVNLSVAKVLAKALKKEGRYEVHLTRTTDEFISLPDRAEFANKLKADLFISLHCNASLKADSNGFEVYFLSERATDDAAAAVARRENASLELDGPAGKAKAQVKQLLWSLAKTEDLNESSEMAALISGHARKNLDVTGRGVKQAGFYVLKWVRMPAVLVESAFITNPREEKKLRSPGFLDDLVATVINGVRDYEKRKVQARVGEKPGSGT